MNLDEFQMNRLEVYFAANATDEVKARREAEGLTIKGAYEWVKSRLMKSVEDGEIKPDSNGMVVGDDEWCYAQMMHYFIVCKEGDVYRTPDEIKAKEEAKAKRDAKRKAKEEAKRKAAEAQMFLF